MLLLELLEDIMSNPLNEHVKARPAGMPDAPREDYQPPKRPYRRGEYMEKNSMPALTKKTLYLTRAVYPSGLSRPCRPAS